MADLNLKDLVKDNNATFLHYQNGELWYEVNGFHFPVPIQDTGTGHFPSSIKAITLMRWIRKHLIMLDQAREAQPQ
jgi:hypothetical protein